MVSPHSKLSTARRKFYNVLLDIRYGRILSGVIPSRYSHLGATHTANSDYSALAVLFKGRIKKTDVLVDVGCGKGRVINWWLNQGLPNRMIGIELDEDIAQQTRERLSKHPNVEIITGNAVNDLPSAGTLFYLYNPFQAEIVAAFKHRLKQIVDADHNRIITVVYYNSRHLDLFLNDARCTVTLGEYLHPFAIIEMKYI
jgi:SAM-dependent methyltransferase